MLHNIFPQHSERMSALNALHAAMSSLVTTTSAAESENREQIDKLRVSIVEALCLMERELPKTEHAVIFHIMLHIPDQIYRWGCARNFWCFFGERMVAYYVNFIGNRDLATENIMYAYCRGMLITRLAPVCLQDQFLQRVAEAGLLLPTNSFLNDDAQYMSSVGPAAGLYKLRVVETRRNHRLKQVTPELINAYRALRATAPSAAAILPAPTEDRFGQVATAMIAGVFLNGREYKQGDVCEYLPWVARRGNADGAGGRAGSSEAHQLCKVNYFIVCQIERRSIVLVHVTPVPILAKERSVYIVPKQIPTPPRKFKDLVSAFGCTTTTHFLHIDSITSKIHVTPHFNNPEWMCALCMFEAR